MQFKQAIDTEMPRDATEIRGIKHSPMFTAIYTSSLDNFRVLFLFGHYLTPLIIYKEMFLGCDWLIRVQLIPNITQNSAKICNTVQKSVTTVQKSVTQCKNL